MEPIYRVQRREPGAEPVQRVERPRLLTPAEREQAKKDREKKRQKGFRPPSSQVRTSDDVTRAQVPRGGADYKA